MTGKKLLDSAGRGTSGDLGGAEECSGYQSERGAEKRGIGEAARGGIGDNGDGRLTESMLKL